MYIYEFEIKLVAQPFSVDMTRFSVQDMAQLEGKKNRFLILTIRYR